MKSSLRVNNKKKYLISVSFLTAFRERCVPVEKVPSVFYIRGAYGSVGREPNKFIGNTVRLLCTREGFMYSFPPIRIIFVY